MGGTGGSSVRTDRRGEHQQADEEFVEAMAQVATTHWWYRARRAWIERELTGRIPTGAVAVDVGTGSGETLATLLACGARVVTGTDLSQGILELVASRPPHHPVARATAESLPYATGSVGCLTSLDVIEHLDDDGLALREYRRVLQPGGALLVTVPAYEWLWSSHDDLSGHRRRYTARQLTATITAAGFTVERATYLFSFLVPPAFLLRRTPLRRFVLDDDSDLEVTQSRPAIDATFALLARIERRIGRRVLVPFGLSILVVARR
jgi:ubiquinone/menaquinone biosynthesis C-methylase UbiE